MTKRKRKATESTRMTVDDAGAIRQLAEATGWSQAKTLTFILARGWEVLHSNAPEFAAARAILQAAIQKQKVQAAAAAKIATLNKQIRDAQKTIETQ